MNHKTLNIHNNNTFKMRHLTLFFFTTIIVNCVGIGSLDKKPKLNKCCATKMFVGREGKSKKVCKESAEPLDFSHLPIFDYAADERNRTFYDIFDVVPDRFGSDQNFHDAAVNTIVLKEFNVYLTEHAVLYLEKPNAYNRWTKVETDKFCVDYFMNKKGTLQPAFWFRILEDNIEKNDDFLTAAMLTSCAFLLVVLVVYGILPELRNLCGLILMAYVLSLLIALLLLAVIRIKIHNQFVCYRLTLVIYYSFLASFCWMTVMSYDIWWTFRGYAKARPIHRRGEHFKYIMYSLYAWGLPLCMTLMLAWINAQDFTHIPWFIKPNLPSVGCFIEGGEKLLYLYMPMLILIFSNWAFYLMTAFNIWRLSRGTSVLDSAAAGTPAAHRTHRHRFLVYLKLSIVMGLNWVLEVVSFVCPGFRLWYLTDAYNILIGVSIFLIFVCKKTILRKLVKAFVKARHSKSHWYPGNSSRSNTSDSEVSQETQTLQVCVNPKGPNAYIISNNF